MQKMTITTGHFIPPTGARRALYWACLEARSPTALVVIPPLIGAGAAHPLNTFRWLARSGLDVLSFDYSGHGRSDGHFSLHGSLKDTYRIMAMGRERARERDIPLYGIAACYGAAPMAWAAKRLGEPAAKMVFFNPIPAFDILGIWRG